MPQGKLKVKTKLPTSVKTKASKGKKGPAIQRRGSKWQCEKASLNRSLISIPNIEINDIYYVAFFAKMPPFNLRRRSCRNRRNWRKSFQKQWTLRWKMTYERGLWREEKLSRRKILLIQKNNDMLIVIILVYINILLCVYIF